MATRVGTGAVGTTVTASKTITAGNGGFGHVKWEGGGTAPASFTDSLGNVWTVAQSVRHSTGNEPGSALIYCLSFTTGGAMTLSPTGFSVAPTFQRTEIEEWAPAGGTSFALDIVATSAQGTGTGAAFTYNAVSTTASAAGVAFFAVSDYSTLGGISSSGGTPAFTVGNASSPNGDSFLAYATVTGAGSVAPSVTVSGGTTRWVQQLMMIKEVTGGTSYTLTADTTTYSISGQAANLVKSGTYSLTADQGIYSVTGQAATLTLVSSTNYVLTAAQGSYAITGSDALVDYTFNAAQGSYTFTGQAANLVYTPAAGGITYTLVADQGSYAVSGQVATADYTMAANFGTYAVSGIAANLTYVGAAVNYTLIADQKTYNINGLPANLVWSGAPVVQGGAHRRRLGIKMSMGL